MRSVLTFILFILFILLPNMVGCDNRDLPEACGEGTREKDGLYDYDGDGYLSDRDCNESDCAINPGSKEVCDGHDNDCDGNADSSDDDLTPIDNDVFDFYIDRDGDQNCSDVTHPMCISDASNEYYTTVRDENGDTDYTFTNCYTVHDDGTTYDEFLEDYGEVNARLLSDFLVKGHEKAQLGKNYQDYWDPCDVEDDEDCKTKYPKCQYMRATGTDEYSEYVSEACIQSQ